MLHPNPEPISDNDNDNEPQRRAFVRHDVQCRARIRIANRQYAGYLHNISQGGAKLRTITPIRGLGAIILRLPDLPPLQCELRWSDPYNAGVKFSVALPSERLAAWLEARVGGVRTNAEIEANGRCAEDGGEGTVRPEPGPVILD